MCVTSDPFYPKWLLHDQANKEYRSFVRCIRCKYREHIWVDVQCREQEKTKSSLFGYYLRENISIRCVQKLTPLEQHVLLSLARNYLCTNNWKTSLQGEHILNYWPCVFSIYAERVGNLDDRVVFRLWKVSLPTLTFNIKWKNPQWCYFRPLTLWFARNNFIVTNISLNLLRR